MKKKDPENKFRNTIALIQLAVVAVESIIYAICKPEPAFCVLVFGFSCIGILIVRFAYNIAKAKNEMHAATEEREDTARSHEPSDSAVIMVKFVGYIVMLFSQVFAFIF
mgnify:FL=1